jgi:hypothetical protein
MTTSRGEISRRFSNPYLPEPRALVTVDGFVGTALFGRGASSPESRATRIRIMISAPMTKTTVNEPKATSAARRLVVALDAADGPLGTTPEIDGCKTGKLDPTAGGVAGVVGGTPAAGVICGGAGRERLGFATERGMTDAAFRSMMTVP